VAVIEWLGEAGEETIFSSMCQHTDSLNSSLLVHFPCQCFVTSNNGWIDGVAMFVLEVAYF